MYSQKTTSRISLRAYFLAGLLMVSIAAEAVAGTITLSWVNISNDGSVLPGTANATIVNNPVGGGSTAAGVYYWNINSTTGLSGAPWRNSFNLLSYSVDLSCPLASNVTYHVVNDLSTIPTPGAGMGSIAATKLGILANELQVGKCLSGCVSYYDVIQVVVWNVIRGNLVSDIFGVFGNALGTVNGTNCVNEILATLDRLYIAGYSFDHATRFVVGLDDLKQTGGPDQILFVDSAPSFSAPIPAGITLACLGMSCIGGGWLLPYRYRKSQLSRSACNC